MQFNKKHVKISGAVGRKTRGPIGFARLNEKRRKAEEIDEAQSLAKIKKPGMSGRTGGKAKYTANQAGGTCFVKTQEGCFQSKGKSKNFQGCNIPQGKGVWCPDEKIKAGQCAAAKRACKRG